MGPVQPQDNPMIVPGPGNNMIPPGMMPPPMPPPPPSPSLGFQAWAEDPRNALKVQHSMVAPDAPLQPNAGNPSAAATPPAQAPMASIMPPQKPNNMIPPTQPPQAPPPDAVLPDAPMAKMNNMQPPAVQSQLGADTSELQRLQNNGAGLNSIKNPWLRGLARVGDIAGTILAPGVAAAIPGTTVHNWQLQKMQGNRVANDQAGLTFAQKQQQDAAQLADTQSQTAQRTAAAGKADAQSDSYAPITLSKEQAESIGHPELEGQQLNSKAYTLMLTGKQKTDSAENVAGDKNDTQKTIAANREKRIRDLADATNKTKLLLQDKKDATSAGNTTARINAKGTTAPGGGKVPADVTKRAALASNVNENADAAQEILGRRPDIVGAGGGRYTNVQQMIGSDDADIQALGVRMHNIALASNGAHGLRSAEAVAKTENDLFNNFKTGPQGIKAGLDATRGSVQTFLDDEKNFQTTGQRTGGNNMVPPAQGGAKGGAEVWVRGKDGKLVKQ